MGTFQTRRMVPRLQVIDLPRPQRIDRLFPQTISCIIDLRYATTTTLCYSFTSLMLFTLTIPASSNLISAQVSSCLVPISSLLYHLGLICICTGAPSSLYSSSRQTLNDLHRLLELRLLRISRLNVTRPTTTSLRSSIRPLQIIRPPHDHRVQSIDIL